ncbi:MAG: hypothetical protein QM820_33275 [Minicystis sp.]
MAQLVTRPASSTCSIIPGACRRILARAVRVDGHGLLLDVVVDAPLRRPVAPDDARDAPERVVLPPPRAPAAVGAHEEPAQLVVVVPLHVAARIGVLEDLPEVVRAVAVGVAAAVDHRGLERLGPEGERGVVDAPRRRPRARLGRGDVREDVAPRDLAPRLHAALLPGDDLVAEAVGDAVGPVLADEVVLLVVRVAPLDAAAIDDAHEVAAIIQLVRHEVAAVLRTVGVLGGQLPVADVALARDRGAAAAGIDDGRDLVPGPLDVGHVAVPVAQLGEAVEAALLVGPEHAQQAVVDVDADAVLEPDHVAPEGERGQLVLGRHGDARGAQLVVGEEQPVAVPLRRPVQAVRPPPPEPRVPLDVGAAVGAIPLHVEDARQQEVERRRGEHGAGDDVDGVTAARLPFGAG